jgi:hypothetical protein
MNKKTIGTLYSVLFLGLAMAAGPTRAQDNPDDSVDCFFASNATEAACQTASPVRIAKKNSLPEYSETVAESVDCFYAENDGEAACGAKSITASSALDKVVSSGSRHGS